MKFFNVLLFSLMLGVAPAWADVDISGKTRVEVSDWAGLKAAVEGAGKDTVIVLTGDITADVNNPITSVGNTGVVIDGGGHTITGQEGTSDGQFIKFDDKDKTDLIIQNIKIEGFGNVQGKYAYGGAIYNSGTIGDITGDFTDNYAQYTGTSSYYYAKGGAIYN